MPTFDYSAIDRQGRSVQGRIEANSRDEAAINLTKTGLLVSKIAEAAGSATVPPRRAPVTAKPASAPQPKPRLAAPPVVRTPTKANVNPIRTRRGTDKDLYFVFSQLQSYAKAGLNPVEALTNVANNCRREDYAQALRQAADAAKEGRPMSDVLQRYVDLFPPHVVGMVRAAEHGGFFPEAFDIITDQAMASHKIRKWFVWLLAIAVMVGVCMPLTWLLLRAALDSWDAQEKAGGQASGWSTLYSSIGHELIWPMGPITLALIVGTWLFSRFWQAQPRRELRHRLVMMVPTVKKRARAESLAVFAWTMGMLAKLGLPPRTVWELSAGTVPNLEVKRQLAETGMRMGEQTKLSEALSMSRTVPEEYAPIVQTGEITGDIPTALQRASSAQLDEFKAGDSFVKAHIGCWMLLLIFIGSAVMFGMFYGGFYKMLADKILGE